MIDVGTLLEAGRRAGLHAVGVCRAEPFADTARVLRRRKQAGLHGGMQFTYRNPDRSTDPSRLLPGATALVVGAVDYHESALMRSGGEQVDASVAVSASKPVGSGEPGRRRYEVDASVAVSAAEPGSAAARSGRDVRPKARVAAYARADHYAVLRDALSSVASLLRAEGCRAVVSADENHLVDRAAAHRAGIGWWGKSASILVPGAGSMVVLGAVVTDAPIDVENPPPVADGCGPCRRCLDGCPTGAITAPGVVDARRCLAWLLQADGVFDPRFRVALGDRIYGCDECSDVCPPNRVRLRRSRRRSDGAVSAEDEPASDGGARVPVLDMLSASDAELMRAYGRWYIPRRQPRYLRRNALVVLGNVGDPSQARVRSAVGRALADPDPLIAAHAVWCARRLGLGLDGLMLHDDPMVAEELERDVPPRAGRLGRDAPQPASL